MNNMSLLDAMALAQAPGWSGWWIIACFVGVIGFFILLVAAQFFRLWLQAFMSNAEVRMTDLIGMRLRKVNMSAIVFARIQLVKAGIHDTTVNDLESHFLAGGRVDKVTRAMIAANRAALALDWNEACAIDLAGRDLTDAINTSVNPKVIDIPDLEQGRSSVDAVARDGIQLKAKARITVRTNIRQLIGGATEQTIIARVGEGIVSAIGSSQTYKAVLENPNQISKAVPAEGPRFRNRIRDTVDRYCRPGRRREYRRQATGRSGPSRHPPLPGRSRENAGPWRSPKPPRTGPRSKRTAPGSCSPKPKYPMPSPGRSAPETSELSDTNRRTA